MQSQRCSSPHHVHQRGYHLSYFRTKSGRTSPLLYIKLACVVPGLLKDSQRCCPPSWRRLSRSAGVVSLHGPPAKQRVWPRPSMDSFIGFSRQWWFTPQEELAVCSWVGCWREIRSDCTLAYLGFGASSRAAALWSGHVRWCSSEPWICSASLVCWQSNNRPSTFWLPLLPPAHMWHKNVQLFFSVYKVALCSNQIKFGERVSYQPEASDVRAGNLRISI